MTLASTSTSRWAVSGRTSGEVLAAEIVRPGVRLMVLGVPGGYSAHELEGWLHDLAGVALETSQADTRTRSIPALLHHALTGLLFSHAELWDRLDGPRPCSCAFIDTPEGASFGWVGDARVHAFVNGDAIEPQWVRVRDDAGREARAATFAPGQVVVLSLQCWLGAPEDGAPVCAIEAEWNDVPEEDADDRREDVDQVSEPNAVAPVEASAVAIVEPVEPPVVVQVPAPPLPDSLPQHQPGLAAAPHESARVEASMPSHAERAEAAPPITSAANTPTPSKVEESESARPGHPVARWLARVMRWGNAEPRPSAPAETPASGAQPVSAYDALLSEAVPPTPAMPEAVEQTAFELPAPAPAPKARLLASTEPMPEGMYEEPTESENVERLSAFLREIESTDVASLPVLSPEVSAPTSESQVEVDHEPVGADREFGIPPLPERPVSEAPAQPAETVLGIPQLPPAIAPRPAEESAPDAPLTIEHTAKRAAEPARTAPLPAAAIAAQPPKQPVAAPLALESGFGYGPPTIAMPARTDEGAGARTAPVTGATPPMLKVAVPVATFSDLAASPHEDPMFMNLPLPPPGLRTPRSFEAPPPPRKAWNFMATRDAHDRPLPWFRRPPVWAGGVLLVFFFGWLVGSLANPAADRGGPMMAALRSVGIGAAQFTATINSRPGGAQIEIDGKPQATRTPSTIDLPPGEHTVRLLMPGLGSVTVPLRGRNGEKVTVDESLHGTLEVLDADATVPISVTLDGKPVGYAPLKLDHVEPGLHEVHFTGPGMPAFAQTVEVGIRGTAQLVARPMSAPAEGVIVVQATLNDERGATPLPGAQVFVDGELRGFTPKTFELPRGPHSLRVTFQNEVAPVQVIDLPGGNQRYAAFNFGLDQPDVTVTPLGSSRVFAAGQPKVVSVSVRGLRAADIGELWLRARSSEGLWRRLPMTVVPGAGSLVVTGVLPDELFDARSATRWYVSVVTPQGDEYFSEMQESSLPGVARAAAPKAATATP